MKTMIRWKLAEIMGREHIRGKALAEATGLTEENISRLRNATEVKRVEGKTLNSLCKALNCQPGDLMEFIPDGEGQEAA